MTGKSGSGKTFTLKQLETELSREQYQVILFEGGYEYDYREYYPFKKALFLREDSTKKIIIGGVAEASKGCRCFLPKDGCLGFGRGC